MGCGVGVWGFKGCDLGLGFVHGGEGLVVVGGLGVWEEVVTGVGGGCR